MSNSEVEYSDHYVIRLTSSPEVARYEVYDCDRDGDMRPSSIPVVSVRGADSTHPVPVISLGSTGNAGLEGEGLACFEHVLGLAKNLLGIFQERQRAELARR